MRNLLAGVSAIAIASIGNAKATTMSYNSYSMLNDQAAGYYTVDKHGSHFTSIDAGELELNVQIEAGGGHDAQFNVWNIDLFRNIPKGGAIISQVDYLSGTNMTYDKIIAVLSHTEEQIDTNINASAGIQIAIWDLMYGYSATFGEQTGVFGLNADTSLLAQSYIDNVNNGVWKAEYAQGLTVISTASGGNMAYLNTNVPEPTSIALLVTGLLGLGAARKRSRALAG